jgi:hypothetical protein
MKPGDLADVDALGAELHKGFPPMSNKANMSTTYRHGAAVLPDDLSTPQ